MSDPMINELCIGVKYCEPIREIISWYGADFIMSYTNPTGLLVRVVCPKHG
jgi:hypothetical protein